MRQLVNCLTGILCLMLPFFACGQEAPSRVTEIVSFDNPDHRFDPFVDSLANYAQDTISVIVMVVLPNGQAPDSIHVLLGSTAGNDNLANKFFKYDGAASLPDGSTYRKEGGNVYLGLGHFNGVAAVFSKVQLVYSDGTRTRYTSSTNE